MALVKCRECGTEISNQTKSCPKCGAKNRRPVGLFGAIFIGALGIIFVSAAIDSPDATTNHTPTVADAGAGQSEKMKQGLAALDSNLKSLTPAEVAALEKHKIKVRKENAKQRRKEGVTLGMTEADVRASNWGKPRKINTTTATYGTRAQWVYDGGYLYFTDGVLTSIQN